jgi:plasmid maintenance system antidote protein VapI
MTRTPNGVAPDTSSTHGGIVLRNVILLHTRGWSVRAIAEDLGVPKSTVQDMIDRWRSAPRVLRPRSRCP